MTLKFGISRGIGIIITLPAARRSARNKVPLKSRETFDFRFAKRWTMRHCQAAPRRRVRDVSAERWNRFRADEKVLVTVRGRSQDVSRNVTPRNNGTRSCVTRQKTGYFALFLVFRDNSTLRRHQVTDGVLSHGTYNDEPAKNSSESK